MIPNNSIIIVLGGGALMVVLLLLSALGGESDDQMERRLLRASGNYVEAKKAANKQKTVQSMRRVTTYSAIPFLDHLIRALMPNPDKLRTRLARTGHNLSLGEYLLINLIIISIGFLICFFILHWSRTTSIFCGVAFGLFIPHMVTGIMGGRRIRKFLANFPEAIDTMCRGLRSGLPVTESIAAVGREMPDPVGIEFRRISDGVRMGRPLEDAMWDVTRRIDVPEFRFLIISMTIQKETGGNLAETLGNLADLIRKRRQLKLKIRAMSSEARASAMIIGSLPFVMFCILYVVNGDYIMLLFRTTTGNFLLGFGFTMIALGVGVMAKMIHFEV